jgi:hypothetical protein
MGNKATGKCGIARPGANSASEMCDLIRSDVTTSTESLSTVASVKERRSGKHKCLMGGNDSMDGSANNSTVEKLSHSSQSNITDDDGETVNKFEKDFYIQETATKLLLVPAFSNVVIPDHISNKLTTEDWNELVNILCQSLERSLKSMLSSENDINYDDEVLAQHENTDGNGYWCRNINNNHIAKCVDGHASISPSQSHHSLDMKDERADVQIENRSENRSKGRNKLSSKHKSRCKCDRRYITLGQLKDLGLTLRGSEDATNNQETLSLRCSASTNHHNHDRKSKRTQRKLEELCYLGPLDEEIHSSTSNIAVADLNLYDKPPSYFEIKHFHRHKHKHIHFVHHHTTTTHHSTMLELTSQH